MNKVILMSGSIIFVYIFILLISPNYKDIKKHTKLKEDEYISRLNIGAALISIMINFLTWGWFL